MAYTKRRSRSYSAPRARGRSSTARRPATGRRRSSNARGRSPQTVRIVLQVAPGQAIAGASTVAAQAARAKF